MQIVSNPSAPIGQALTGPQQRALKKPLRALSAAIRDLAPRKAPRRIHERLLYRSAVNLTDSDLDRLVREIGVDRMGAAVERATCPQPQLPLVAAE